MKKIIGYVTSSSNTLVFNYDKPKSKDYKVIRISIPDDMQIMYSMTNKTLLLHNNKPVIIGFEGSSLYWYKYDLIETDTDVYEGNREKIVLEYDNVSPEK